MTTPILDFVRAYAASGTSRLHMPGHKGEGPIGCEAVDITEIRGADDLSCPEGIIAESEANAASLFGSRATFYSTGGSSQCVKAMLLLAARRSKSRVVLAARNAHKSFIHACALLDLLPEWLYPEGETSSLCSCRVTPDGLRAALGALKERPCAVYITSPDYLGGMQDVRALAAAAHEYGAPLLVDNAHGAYLAFLQKSAHPIVLGADMCCDSAHKTLAVLTGGAYLHVSRESVWDFERDAHEALGVMGSSSPSYLVLASLDAMNARLADEGVSCRFEEYIDGFKKKLASMGLAVQKSDPAHITLAAYESGYTGFELADMLRARHVEPEYADTDWLVLMPSPENRLLAYDRVLDAFSSLEKRAPRESLPVPGSARRAMTPHEALLAPRESVPVSLAAGRIAASAAVSCPPAIPVAVMGEEITAGHAVTLEALGFESVEVVK